MSVNRDMKTITLQANNPKRTASGAMNDCWEGVCDIDAAIYKTSDFITVESVKYNEASHVGLTLYKHLKEGTHRLKDGNVVYEIIGCNTKPRLTNLLLKVVDDYARQ